jgi:hypothetical protein
MVADSSSQQDDIRDEVHCEFKRLIILFLGYASDFLRKNRLAVSYTHVCPH